MEIQERKAFAQEERTAKVPQLHRTVFISFIF